ncbi:hypothetical protein [Acinetobacter sp.]|uniref:hypothetical protein n=1 Tax=Acinetobacter sp. TaxID=472 RepID=UPI002FCBEDA1
MEKATGLSRRRCQQLYCAAAWLLLTYCALNAAYFAVIGGMAFYFFAAVILMLQQAFLMRPAPNQWIFQGSGLLILAVLLFGAAGLHLFSAAALIPSMVLTLLSISLLNTNPRIRIALKISFIFGLMLLAYAQHHELNALQAHYASFKSGGTWQQFGAL